MSQICALAMGSHGAPGVSRFPLLITAINTHQMGMLKSRSSWCDKSVGELDSCSGERLGNAVRASGVGVLVVSPLPAGGAPLCTSTPPMSEIYFLSPRGSRWQKLFLFFSLPSRTASTHTVLDVGWFLQLLGGVFWHKNLLPRARSTGMGSLYHTGIPQLCFLPSVLLLLHACLLFVWLAPLQFPYNRQLGREYPSIAGESTSIGYRRFLYSLAFLKDG